MTEKMKERVLVIQDTELTNMFDVNTVQRLAYEREIFDLVIWLENQRREYDRFLYGEEKRIVPSEHARLFWSYTGGLCAVNLL